MSKSRKPFCVVRRILPDSRKSIIHDFNIDGHKGRITVGMFEDGSPGELSVKMSNQEPIVSGLLDSVGLIVSASLQCGVPLQILAKSVINQRFEPRGMTGCTDIAEAKSVTDYVFRWLWLQYGK